MRYTRRLPARIRFYLEHECDPGLPISLSSNFQRHLEYNLPDFQSLRNLVRRRQIVGCGNTRQLRAFYATYDPDLGIRATLDLLQEDTEECVRSGSKKSLLFILDISESMLTPAARTGLLSCVELYIVRYGRLDWFCEFSEAKILSFANTFLHQPVDTSISYLEVNILRYLVHRGYVIHRRDISSAVKNIHMSHAMYGCTMKDAAEAYDKILLPVIQELRRRYPGRVARDPGPAK